MNSVELHEAVLEALKNYHNLLGLEKSRLGELQAIWPLPASADPATPPSIQGGAVRFLLDRALERLEGDLPSEAAFLRLRFVQGKPMKSLESILHLAPATLHLHQKQAVAALTSTLAAMEAEVSEARLRRRSVHHARIPIVLGDAPLLGVDGHLAKMRKVLQASLKRPQLPILVTGLGGSGKSYLLATALHNWLEQEDPPLQQVVWSPLEPTMESDQAERMERLLSQISHQIDLIPDPTWTDSRYLEMLRRHLRTLHPCVIVLDNVESAEDLKLVRRTVHALGAVAQFLIASRREIPGLAAELITLTDLTWEDARTLLQREIQQRGLESPDDLVFEKLFALVGGHPLALKLLAGLMAQVPGDEVVTSLSYPLELAEQWFIPIYDLTWQILSPLARDILVGLTLFPATGATWEGAQVIARSSRHFIEGASVQAIKELGDLNLAQVTPRPTTYLYTLHRLTAYFVEQRLRVGDQQEMRDLRVLLTHQLSEYAAHLLGETTLSNAKPLSLSSLSEQTMTLLSKCRMWGADALHLRIVGDLGERLARSTHMGELDHHLQLALASPLPTAAQRLEFAILRSRLLMQRHGPDAALAVLQEMEPVADTPILQALLYNRRGVLLGEKGEHAAAQAALEHALHCSLTMPAQAELLSTLYNNLGNLAYQQGHYLPAQRYYEQALEVAPETAWLHQAQAKGGMAMVLIDSERYEEATRFQEAARRQYKQAGDELGIVRILLNQSLLSLRQSAWKKAKQQAKKALHKARKLGDQRREAAALHNLGYACFRAGDYEAGVDHLLAALEQRRWLGITLYTQTTEEVLHEVLQALEGSTGLDPLQHQRLLERCTAALATTTP